MNKMAQKYVGSLVHKCYQHKHNFGHENKTIITMFPQGHSSDDFDVKDQDRDRPITF